MIGYTKLFNTILGSTIWMEDNTTRIVWITLMAKADRDGNVWASLPGLAHFARVSQEDCKRALAKFLSPDPESTSKVDGGRRIREVEGGWQLVNHAKYRKMMSLENRREYMAKKQAEYRAMAKAARKGMVVPEILAEKAHYRKMIDKEDGTLREEPVPYVTKVGDMVLPDI